MIGMQELLKKHEYLTKLATSIIYGFLVAIAMNVFWTPGKIYSSGITGTAQLIATLTAHAPVHLSAALMIFVLNVPLFILAWYQLGHVFTVFTFVSVVCSSIMIKAVEPVTLTTDPIICSIFGGIVNGFGTGMCLKHGISTGGLDILGLTIRKLTGKSIGTINIAFNTMIVIAAGAVYGWPYAFYSALGLFVNARMMDMIYTRQQKVQVMIITNKPKSVIDCIQNHIRRGITIVNGAEGAYHHDKKTILLTVISRFEQPELKKAMEESDPDAFVSIAENVQIMGHFYEPKP